MLRAGGENCGDEEYQKCPIQCHDMQRYDFFCNAVSFFRQKNILGDELFGLDKRTKEQKNMFSIFGSQTLMLKNSE